MARRKLEEKNIRKITKSGGKSYSMTLPIEFVRILRWRESQKVVVSIDKRRKRLIIKDWKKKS